MNHRPTPWCPAALRLPATVERVRAEARRYVQHASILALAGGAGVHRNTVTAWLRYDQPLSTRSLLKIAQWLTQQPAPGTRLSDSG